LTGRVGAAVQRLAQLLNMAIELGWSSIAGLLGALLVGLNGTRGKYEEAVRWYERLASPSNSGMRLGDRAHLAIEASHAFTMLGKPADALAILGYRQTENEWPRVESASWHVCVAEALERSGEPAAALPHAEQAWRDYDAAQVLRGSGNAHRVIALCYGRLGDLDRAKEHVSEAQRLIETNGTPYALLRTLVAKAGIEHSQRVKSDAIEFAQMLRALDEDPATA
jgi:tetratricopeptide (TPR) repeat protein